MKVVFVDVETTGLSLSDRVVSIGAVKVDPIESVADALYALVDPGKESHPRALEIHGWDDWTLRHQHKFLEIAESLEAFINDAQLIVSHNSEFDGRFINDELIRAGRQPLTIPFACTLNMARRYWPGLPCGLDDCLSRIGIASRGRKHTALVDAVLCGRLYSHLIGSALDLKFDPYVILPMNYTQPPPRPTGEIPRRC